uniref:Periplasmic chaperone PpiD n=1 Tax=Magnetococcus massalia (strain MO-1) TaxID=451514 RepID=A0A1S7LFY6_MAGMO|nr:putative peptidylprolyl isomerase [Candidatus Magnetococcus massalia]
MLNFMRQSANSWLIKALLIFLAMTFAVWGVGDYVTNKQGDAVLVVEDWSASYGYLAQTIDREARFMRQQFGDGIDAKMLRTLAKQRVLSGTIQRRLMLNTSANLRLTLSPESLKRQIANDSNFQRNGQFSDDLYRLLLRNNRMSPKDYELQQREEARFEHLSRALSTVAAVPTLMLDDAQRMTSEKRQAELLILDKDVLPQVADPGDKVLREYQEKHREGYTIRERVKVTYLLLDSNSVRDELKISDQEVADYYEENRHEFQQPESRITRHILAKVEKGKEGSRADAEAKIAKAQERLKAGDRFADVAMNFSDDVTAQNGGSLGSVTKGVMVPAFEEATFALAEGQVSDVVESPFGLHLILVEKINGAGDKPLERVREEVRETIFQQRAQEAVYQKSIAFEDMVASGADLKEVGKELNLRHRETNWLEKANLDGARAIEKLAKFHEVAFSTPKGETSTVVELPQGRYFTLRVNERKEPELKQLADVRDDLLKAYRLEKSATQGDEIMAAAMKKLQDKGSWEEVAKSHALMKSQTSELFSMTNFSDKLPQRVRQAAFQSTLESPLHPRVVSDGSKLYIVKLNTVEPGTYDPAKSKDPKILARFGESLGSEQLEAFLTWRQKNAEITINNQLFEKL